MKVEINVDGVSSFYRISQDLGGVKLDMWPKKHFYSTKLSVSTYF